MAADDCCYNNQYPVFTSLVTHFRLSVIQSTTTNDEKYCTSIKKQAHQNKEFDSKLPWGKAQPNTVISVKS